MDENKRIMDLCEARRLHIERITHLGALAMCSNGKANHIDEVLEDVVGALQRGVSAKQVLEAIPGLELRYDEEPGEPGEMVDDGYGFMDAALDGGKMGFVIEVQTPVLEPGDDEGSWGLCTIGYFYGDTLLAAVEAAAERMPFLADRRHEEAGPVDDGQEDCLHNG